VNVRISADARRNDEQLVRVNSGSGIAVSPNGKEIAFIFRGEVFVSSVEGGITKRITNTPVQENSVGFSPDGKSIIYASERNNKWSIHETRMVRADELYFYASTLLKENALIEN
ncbi:MAG TPA: peptidase S41, partial [Chitinophagaceae bacterium]|nr:peptidase S41 [Chitinophagaceae bacterium]